MPYVLGSCITTTGSIRYRYRGTVLRISVRLSVCLAVRLSSTIAIRSDVVPWRLCTTRLRGDIIVALVYGTLFTYLHDSDKWPKWLRWKENKLTLPVGALSFSFLAFHRHNIKYSLDTWLANQTTAKAVVTIVCRIEIEKWQNVSQSIAV